MSSLFLHFTRRRALPLLVASALLIAALPNLVQPAQAQASTDGVQAVTGTVKVTNRNLLDFFIEQPVMLMIDMTAFLKRDKEMKITYPDKVTSAGLVGDIGEGATFTMSLPIQPTGVLNDVSHGKDGGQGVMIFTVDYNNNDGSVAPISSGPLVPTKWKGWPGGLDSLDFNEDTQEVTAGNMLVWAPDDKQMFPSGFGADGLLFTEDDPVAAIPAGYTIVNLDKQPFVQVRDKVVDVRIIEGADAQLDYSKSSYTEAYDKLLNDLRNRYAFRDVKNIDFDAIDKEIRPLVEKAESSKSKSGFATALQRLSNKFPDGHVYLNPPAVDYILRQEGGGAGLVLGETDDGEIIAADVLGRTAASKAGIKPGAKILEWNGKPIKDAIEATPLIISNASSAHYRHLLQLRAVTHGAINKKVKCTYQNPGDSAEKTVELKLEREVQSLFEDPPGFKVETDPADLPIVTKVLPSGYGYIRINGFYTKPTLFTYMWDEAIRTMNGLGVPGVIIDMRENGGGFGGLATYAAGSFYTEKFTLSNSFYYTASGKLKEGGPDEVEPSPQEFGGAAAVIISPNCASACEIFTAAMAHSPDHPIVGSYPTMGIEGGVKTWLLPDKLEFNAPATFFKNADGSLFVEGFGVSPTVRVPITAERLMKADDAEIKAAENAIVELLGK